MIKEGVSIDSTVLSTELDLAQVTKLLENVEELVDVPNRFQINADSRQVLQDMPFRNPNTITETFAKAK